MKTIKSNYIQNLIAKGESQELDFKYCITDSRKIAKSLVAFANTDGGKLLIGVKDNGAIAGIRSDEEFYMIEAAAQLYSKPTVFFETKVWNVNGKTVLEITVPKSKNKPYYAQNDENKWLVYIRSKDKNIIANTLIIKVWKRQSENYGTFIKYREIEKILLDYLDKNKIITITMFCKQAKINRFKAEVILINLILMKIIEMEFTEKGVFYRLNENFCLAKY